jgi:molecular chaperone DnaJ
MTHDPTMGDLYATLGLDRGASVADIKRAYRRLARKYHPGINPGDRAAQSMFERVSEAYETLIDPDRRRAYDTAGRAPSPDAGTTFEFAGFDFSMAARGPQAATFTELFAEVLHPPAPLLSGPERGADVHAAVTLGFEESMRGAERHVMVTRQVECPGCRGAGQVRTPETPCAHCRGAGHLRWARGHMVFSKPCAACQGTGRQQMDRCARCAGHGRGVRTEPVAVRIPAGVPDGARLRIPEQGHAGRHGGPAGDVYVDIRVQPHPVLKRHGDDLHMVVPVAVHEAVLGARITVPSLDGPLKVTVRPSTQAGDAIRVSGRGVPRPDGSRGDLVLDVRLVLPPAVDDRSRELMREFGRLYDGDVRRDMRI